MHVSSFGVCYEVRSFVLRQAEELGGIPEEIYSTTVSFYSSLAVGDSRGPAPVDVLSVPSERPTETIRQASVIFSNGGCRNY